MDPPPASGFDKEQLQLLKTPLNKAHVKTRRQGGKQLSYLEGWHLIDEANFTFGFDQWWRETISFSCVNQQERLIGENKRNGWGVTYIAKVKITVYANGLNIIREGCGAGHGIDVDLGLAHESALKEAETDAMKRALMTFGYRFGLALYDKAQANVEDEPKMESRFSTLVAEIDETCERLYIVDEVLKICKKSGLTEQGIASFALKMTKGSSNQLKDLSQGVLDHIVKLGDKALSPETIAQCNGTQTQPNNK
jgi:hypothetical protein